VEYVVNKPAQHKALTIVRFKIVTGDPAKAITAFNFQGLSPPVTDTVTAANASTQDYTVTVTVAAGQVCHGRNRNDERLDPGDILSCRIL